MKPIHIAFSGGKSGGHIKPSLQLAHQLEPLGYKSFFIACHHKIDRQLLSDVPSLHLHIPHFPHWVNPVNCIPAIIKSMKFLHKNKIKLIFGAGGYPSIFGVIAAYILKIPIILFEQNRIPGKAQKWLLPLAKFWIGSLPIESKYCTKKKQLMIPIQYNKTSQEPSKPHFLWCGGSQGAHFINQLASEIIPLFPHFEFTVILGLCFEKDQHKFQELTNTKVLPFTPEIGFYYQKSNAIISRAGSGTLIDLLKFSKPSFLIPYPHANQHQSYNASFWSKNSLGKYELEESPQIKEKVIQFIRNIIKPQVQEQYAIAFKRYNSKYTPQNNNDLNQLQISSIQNDRYLI